MQTSYSQLGQDTKVVEFYKGKRGGYFVEIGASDGIRYSNTYLLEKEYEWKGICVEPVPSRFELLCKNRPGSSCDPSAVCKESHQHVEFDIAHSCDLFSGIREHIDRHKEYVEKNKTTISVPTLSFQDLLDKYNAPSFIDYLSLDTEGSELEILSSVDLSRYTFGLLDVEHNFVEPRRSQIRELLLQNGYEYIGENKYDDMYRYKNM